MDILKLFLSIILLSLSNTCLAAITVTDFSGHSLSLKKPATRIISLAPNITETLYAIGAGNNLIAVSSASNYPKAALTLPIVASNSQLDLEKIVSLKPDLIIAWKSGNPTKELNKLKSLHIPIFIVNINKLQGVAQLIIKLGQLTGRQQAADKLAKKYLYSLSKLKKKYQHKQHIRVFYAIWQRPLFTIGNRSLISQAIHLCGGSNIFNHMNRLAAQVSLEAVLNANPDVIISGYSNTHWQTYWQRWPALAAARTHQLYYINPDLIQRNGPRLIQGIQQLCRFINKARSYNGYTVGANDSQPTITISR